jgi:5-methylcytosine-specific restriction endonuclease McrA
MNRRLYSTDWCDIIRPAILKRDNYRCKHCGLKHKSWWMYSDNGKKFEIDKDDVEFTKSKGIKVRILFLTVAHINHNKSDNRNENLLSLCSSCHSKFDAAHKRILRMSNFKLRKND